jgi:hypothetical protein
MRNDDAERFYWVQVITTLGELEFTEDFVTQAQSPGAARENVITDLAVDYGQEWAEAAGKQEENVLTLDDGRLVYIDEANEIPAAHYEVLRHYLSVADEGEDGDEDDAEYGGES